jgi:soluble lytic murein transglycosylase-like protein
MNFTTNIKFLLLSIFFVSASIFLTACNDITSRCDFQCTAKQDAIVAGIPPQLYINQINEESGFNPDAISDEGAIGIAQIMPATAAEWQVDPHDPVASLYVAAQHMAWYTHQYGDYAMALGCYNAGCGRVDWALRNCTYWLVCMPTETQQYVHIIMN